MTLMGHKVQVNFTEEQWNLITMFKNSMGKSDADVVRNILLAWLAEKSFISTSVKEGMFQAGDAK